MVIPSELAIKAVMVDHTAQRLQREKEKAEADRKAREQAEAEQIAKEKLAAEQQQREQNAKLEAQRIEDQRQRAAVEQKRKDDAKQAAIRKQSDDKKRVAEIKEKQAQKEKVQHDAREQAQRESELKRQLADEEGRMQAKNSGLLNQYVALIKQRVVRNWNAPASARPGIQCDVRVTQAPGGTVLSVQIDKCNGDSAVRESIEAAVYRSSPLPLPPDSRLFERVIVFAFNPSE